MSKELNNYLKTINGVSHITLNPRTSNVVRIHLIPPKKVKMNIAWVVIINGQDILPLSAGWGILLRIFIEKTNMHSGEYFDDELIKTVINETVKEGRNIAQFIKGMKNDFSPVTEEQIVEAIKEQERQQAKRNEQEKNKTA